MWFNILFWLEIEVLFTLEDIHTKVNITAALWYSKFIWFSSKTYHIILNVVMIITRNSSMLLLGTLAHPVMFLFGISHQHPWLTFDLIPEWNQLGYCTLLVTLFWLYNNNILLTLLSYRYMLIWSLGCPV